MALHIVEFKRKYSRRHGEQDWVLLAPKGENISAIKSWHRVKDLTPPDLETLDEEDAENYRQSPTYKALMVRWEKIRPAYEAWRAGHEIPEEGTPLGAWAGVTAEQAVYLRKYGIHTVENVATMSDGTMARLPFPEPRAIKRMAAQFLKEKPVEDVKAENEELKVRLAALETAILEMNDTEQAAEEEPLDPGDVDSGEPEPPAPAPKPKRRTTRAKKETAEA